VKLVGWGGWPTLGCDRWPWFENVDLYCPENTSMPLDSMLPKLREDLLLITKEQRPT